MNKFFSAALLLTALAFARPAGAATNPIRPSDLPPARYAPIGSGSALVAYGASDALDLSGSDAGSLLLPPRALTPGVIGTTDAARVCTPGFASSVRPRGYAWRTLKTAMYHEYDVLGPLNHFVVGSHYGHEADHLIPLELGGAPDDLRNLWPQPMREARVKDIIENAAHLLVCDGRVPLAVMQRRFATDWRTAVPPGTQFTPSQMRWLHRMASKNAGR